MIIASVWVPFDIFINIGSMKGGRRTHGVVNPHEREVAILKLLEGGARSSVIRVYVRTFFLLACMEYHLFQKITRKNLGDNKKKSGH